MPIVLDHMIHVSIYRAERASLITTMNNVGVIHLADNKFGDLRRNTNWQIFTYFGELAQVSACMQCAYVF